MKKTLKCELVRAFSGKRMWIALFIGAGIAAWHFFIDVLPNTVYLDAYREYPDMFLLPHSSFSMWMGMDGFHPQLALFYMLAPILASFPFASSFLSDKKSGYYKNILVNTSRGHYFASKYIAVFLSAGTAAVVPLLLNLLLTSAAFPSIKPLPAALVFPIVDSSLFGGLFYESPYLYIAIFLLMNFLFFGCLSTVALPLAFSVENAFVVEIAPFLLYFMAFAACSTLNVPVLAPYFFLQPSQPAGASLPEILCILLVLGAGAFLVFFRRGKKYDAY